MADGVQFQVLNTERLIARIGAAPAAMRARLTAAVNSLTQRLAILARARAGSGPLGRSIQTDYVTTVDEITGTAFTEGVPYAAIQEYGGKTGPHLILPVNAKALRFLSASPMPISKSGSSDVVFAKAVHHPGSRIPEKAYMRGALAQMRMAAIAELRIAAGEGIQMAMAAE